MSYAPDAGTARTLFSRASTSGFAAEGEGGPEAPPRDLKKMFLVAGLGILSWVATYVGMLELIEANMGDLPLVHRAIIGFSVAMLMTMIIWLLDQMFAPAGFMTKLCYVAGYVFLTIISVGFGFGFYWKVLESRSESSRSAEAAVSQVQGSLHAASTRLEQLSATLVQLAAVSSEKAEIERAKGTSCPNSKPGDGPRRKMREEDASRFSFASEFVKGRVEAVKGEMSGLNGDLAKISSADKATFDAKTGTRNEFMKGLSRKLDMTVTGFNAFRTDPQLKQLRTDLNDRSDKSTFGDPKSGGFVCPDPQLQQALKGAVRAIDQLPVLEKPAIAAVEGSEATIEAFRRLTATFYGLLSFKLPPSADELRELQQKAVQSVEGGAAAQKLATLEGAGLSKRDYVPLAIAIFVDICLLLVSIGRPVNRLHGLVPKMREAERGPVIEILSRFNDIHRDREVRESFELFRHVVFDLNGEYYVAVPLDAPPRMNPQQREQLRLEAQLLANLFASFEKERIFTRTWTPFTKKIQKKLRRQGSKFAESEAFRVYRFRSGAWSEIILGAVMGAARRADDERRRLGLETGTYTSSRGSGRVPRRDPVFAPEPYSAPVRPPRMDSQMQPNVAPPMAASFRAGRPADGPLPVRPRAGTDGDPRFAGFGDYAQSAKAELAASGFPAPPANSNTSPPVRPASVTPFPSVQAVAQRAEGATLGYADMPAGNVVVHPSAANVAAVEAKPLMPAESASADYGVVLKRETMTIPLSHPMLAQGLPSLLARAAGSLTAQTAAPALPQAAAAGATAIEVEPATEPASTTVIALQDFSQADETIADVSEEAWSETDVTLARRFKPEAAE